MSDDELTECLRLLDAADNILLGTGEHLLAAHLSAVIEPLRSRAGEPAVHDLLETAGH